MQSKWATVLEVVVVTNLRLGALSRDDSVSAKASAIRQDSHDRRAKSQEPWRPIKRHKNLNTVQPKLIIALPYRISVTITWRSGANPHRGILPDGTQIDG